MLGRLFEKMLSCRLQFEGVHYGAFQPNQFGGISQRSTEDTGVFITHLILFPSLNHDILMVVITKAGFPEVVGNFFQSYLTGHKTMYKWDDFFLLQIMGLAKALASHLFCLGYILDQLLNCSLSNLYQGRCNCCPTLMMGLS